MENGLGVLSSTGTNMIRIGKKTQCHPLVQDLVATDVASMEERHQLGKHHNQRSSSVVKEIEPSLAGSPSAKTLRTTISNARIVGCSALTGKYFLKIIGY